MRRSKSATGFKSFKSISSIILLFYCYIIEGIIKLSDFKFILTNPTAFVEYKVKVICPKIEVTIAEITKYVESLIVS